MRSHPRYLFLGGIPQGSVVGLIQFMIYINDLPRAVSSNAKMFTDDTRLFARSDNEDVATAIQEDLDSVFDWSENWQLSFYPQKCKVLGQTKLEAQYTMKASDGCGQQVTDSAAEKDLGVLVDNQLFFKDHVASITSKANRMLGIIRRKFDYLEEGTLITLYKNLQELVRPIFRVRPLLETTPQNAVQRR